MTSWPSLEHTGPWHYKMPETSVLTQWETVILLDCTSREAVNQVGLVHYIREQSSEAIARGYLPPFSSSQYDVLSFLQYMKKSSEGQQDYLNQDLIAEFYPLSLDSHFKTFFPHSVTSNR